MMDSFFLAIFLLAAGATTLGYFLAHLVNSTHIKGFIQQNKQLVEKQQALEKSCTNLKHQAHLLQRSNFNLKGEIKNLKRKLEHTELSLHKKKSKAD